MEEEEHWLMPWARTLSHDWGKEVWCFEKWQQLVLLQLEGWSGDKPNFSHRSFLQDQIWHFLQNNVRYLSAPAYTFYRFEAESRLVGVVAARGQTPDLSLATRQAISTAWLQAILKKEEEDLLEAKQRLERRLETWRALAGRAPSRFVMPRKKPYDPFEDL